ncbi:ferric reductase like transmembrane component-domain-containing protein [Xylariaceae sp. FL0662B]|nr:ferric reductase like transmembrane component-domain-containing protein [Xylariaceae sp. FL0662B]
MSIMRRRLAAFGPLTPTAILAIRDSDMSTATEEEAAKASIAQFSTALNGVDQTTNMLFKNMLWWTMGILCLLVLSVRLFEIGWTRLRHVSAMAAPADRQRYWKTSQWSWMPSLKKNLIYAPLWSKRHNREIKLSSAINIGTLPSRLHFIILMVYIISNLVYMLHVDWRKENKYSIAAEIRGRSGTLSVVSMIPLIILAGRNNPLIGMLKVSFDTYNLLHRWMGRVVVVEAAIHTIAWLYVQAAADGWDGVGQKLLHESFIASGFVGTLALLLILFLSLGPVRHAFYETFLNVHIILAVITFAMTWVHCATAALPGGLPQLPWMVAIFLIWLAERFSRMFRLSYHNWSSKGVTEAVLEAMPGETTRVTMHLPRYVDVGPGTHAYVRFKGVNPWENHPFSIAWVEHHPERDGTVREKEYSEADLKRGTTSVSFVIGAYTGFTRRLYNKASTGGGQPIRIRAAMEGPYAGHHSLESYGHAVLFAGSTGITHQLSYLKPLLKGFNQGTIATRRVTLVWVMRDTEALEWVRPWMDEILHMPQRRDILNIRLFITRPKNTKEIHSASSTAVREVQDGNSVVDFVEESFTW